MSLRYTSCPFLRASMLHRLACWPILSLQTWIVLKPARGPSNANTELSLFVLREFMLVFAPLFHFCSSRVHAPAVPHPVRAIHDLSHDTWRTRVGEMKRYNPITFILRVLMLELATPPSVLKIALAILDPILAIYYLCNDPWLGGSDGTTREIVGIGGDLSDLVLDVVCINEYSRAQAI